jgi:DNA polymerase-3 subunit gamma/tau
MPAGHIVSHLEHILGEERVPYDAQALRLLARAADGSMRDALSLTDQAIAYSANQVNEEAVRGMLGALDQSYLIRLLDALADGDGAAVLAVADEMALRSLSFSTALQDLASLLHRIAWAQFAPSSVLDEWPEAGDLRRFAETLSAEQVQLFYQIATIGRSELGLAPDEYAGFTMTLLRMLAFEPAPTGGGGNNAAGAARAAGQTGAAGAKRTGAPTVAALRALPGSTVTAAAAPASAREAQGSDALANKGAASVGAAAAASSAALRSADAMGAQAPSVDTAASQSSAAEAANVVESMPAADEAKSAPSVPAALAPWDDAPADAVSNAVAANAGLDSARVSDIPAKPAPAAAAPASSLTASATAALARTEQAAASQQEPPSAAGTAPRRAGGASAALDVLRSAGLKVSSDRGRATSAAAAAPAAPKPAAAPRVVVPVPTPGGPRRAPQQDAAPAARAASSPPARGSAEQGGSSVPPWDDMPPDDYVPISASDDGYFGPPDDDYMPVFDRGPDDVRMNATATAAAASAPAVDPRPLPPAVPLDPLGFKGDWPALAVDLPLKGISYQLAFNSELMSLEGNTLKLNVPVPQYAEASQVAKLKSALAERLGQNVDVLVEVGAARRTAAANDAALRAQRQQEAEREIGADPFVQSLIREFGASIVPGSIRPITPDAASNGASSVH